MPPRTPGQLCSQALVCTTSTDRGPHFVLGGWACGVMHPERRTQSALNNHMPWKAADSGVHSWSITSHSGDGNKCEVGPMSSVVSGLLDITCWCPPPPPGMSPARGQVPLFCLLRPPGLPSLSHSGPRGAPGHPTAPQPLGAGVGGLLAPIVQRRKPSLRKGGHLCKVTPPESNGAQVEGPRCPASRPAASPTPSSPTPALWEQGLGRHGGSQGPGALPAPPFRPPGCSMESGGCARRGTLSPVTWPPPPAAWPGTWTRFPRAQGSHPAGRAIFPVTVTQLWDLGGRSRPPLCPPQEPGRPGQVSGVPGGGGDPGAP